jgi:hypothetical protein
MISARSQRVVQPANRADSLDQYTLIPPLPQIAGASPVSANDKMKENAEEKM